MFPFLCAPPCSESFVLLLSHATSFFVILLLARANPAIHVLLFCSRTLSTNLPVGLSVFDGYQKKKNHPRKILIKSGNEKKGDPYLTRTDDLRDTKAVKQSWNPTRYQLRQGVVPWSRAVLLPLYCTHYNCLQRSLPALAAALHKPTCRGMETIDAARMPRLSPN